MTEASRRLRDNLAQRYLDAPTDLPPNLDNETLIAGMAGRRSHRRFGDREVSRSLIRLLCAVALAAPSKSDLQQRDIIVVSDPGKRQSLHALIDGQPWVSAAPVFLVFCANNRRQRLIHQWRGKPFANDHLDAFFNATVDAAIALAAFMSAAESVGLGCCPVSAVRQRPAEVSELLGLPDHVFPVAGLGLGWPERPAKISPRLPLSATIHVDRFDDSGLEATIERYDAARDQVDPIAKQRLVEEYGESDAYGWSEDKARHFSKPEHADFGAFVRSKGFDLG